MLAGRKRSLSLASLLVHALLQVFALVWIRKHLPAPGFYKGAHHRMLETTVGQIEPFQSSGDRRGFQIIGSFHQGSQLMEPPEAGEWGEQPHVEITWKRLDASPCKGKCWATADVSQNTPQKNQGRCRMVSHCSCLNSLTVAFAAAPREAHAQNCAFNNAVEKSFLESTG